MIFLILTETWLREHLEAEVSIPGYNIYRSDRNRCKKKRGRNSGGVAIYLKQTFCNSPEVLLEYSSGVIEALCMHIPQANLVICAVYRQPNDQLGGHISRTEQFSEFAGELAMVLNSLPTPTPDIVIGGDLNLPHIEWPSFNAAAGASSDERSMISTLADLCSNHFLSQVVDRPTHRAGNILDIILTNNPEMLISVEVTPAPTTSSHHSVIAGTLMGDQNLVLPDGPLKREKFDQINLHRNDTNWTQIKTTLASANWTELFENCTVSEMLQKFVSTCEEAAYENAPRRRYSPRYGAKKIPRDRKILMKKRTRFRKQYKSARTVARKNASMEKLIDVERKLQDSYIAQDEREEANAIEAIKSNPKYFYSFAARKSKTHCPVGPLEDDGCLVCDPEHMANLFSDQFKGAFSAPMQGPLNLGSDPPNTLSDISFGPGDIAKAIDEIKVNSAPGPDRFPAIMLKKCKDEICRPLYQIWRKSLDEGVIPEQLKISIISPIHKGGQKTMPKNYRPIALTSLLIKIFEKIIRHQIVAFIEENSLMNPNQHGFRTGRSCLSQLLQHFDRLSDLLEKGHNVDIIYLDLAKAFDKLDYLVTLQKLYNFGIVGKVFSWIQAFLTQRRQCVYVGQSLSRMEPVLSGVPQGSVVGPLLYLVMLNDIDSNVCSALVSSFADDTRVMGSISDANDVSRLQADLDNIYRWSEANNAQFNSEKFECIRYGRNKDLIDSTVYYSNSHNTIKSSPCVRDLGVTMSNDCKFTEHIKTVAKAANLKCAWILRVFKTRASFPLLTLWKSLVLPILDYCSQLWSPNTMALIQTIELVQVNFLNKISGMSALDYWDQLKHQKIFSLQRRRERYVCIYVWKILEGIVPNFGIETMYNRRRGRYCKVPLVSSTAPGKIRTIRFGSMGINGPRVFNSLPTNIRNTSGCSVDSFKAVLDRHLSQIPDQPRIPGLVKYCLRGGNSLLDY